MAHNGAKAGFITPPPHSSTARVGRWLFVALVVSVIAVSYYGWTTAVNNTMLQDRVDLLARDFSLMRNQRAAVEKNLVECKNRLTQLQSTHESLSQELEHTKDYLTKMRSILDTEKNAAATCQQKLTTLTGQHADDMKAVTHELTDCKTKLESLREDCVRYGRTRQLHLLRAVYALTNRGVIRQLRDKYDIDTTGVEDMVKQPSALHRNVSSHKQTNGLDVLLKPASDEVVKGQEELPEHGRQSLYQPGVGSQSESQKSGWQLAREPERDVQQISGQLTQVTIKHEPDAKSAQHGDQIERDLTSLSTTPLAQYSSSVKVAKKLWGQELPGDAMSANKTKTFKLAEMKTERQTDDVPETLPQSGGKPVEEGRAGFAAKTQEVDYKVDGKQKSVVADVADDENYENDIDKAAAVEGKVKKDADAVGDDEEYEYNEAKAAKDDEKAADKEMMHESAEARDTEIDSPPDATHLDEEDDDEYEVNKDRLRQE